MTGQAIQRSAMISTLINFNRDGFKTQVTKQVVN